MKNENIKLQKKLEQANNRVLAIHNEMKSSSLLRRINDLQFDFKQSREENDKLHLEIYAYEKLVQKDDAKYQELLNNHMARLSMSKLRAIVQLYQCLKEPSLTLDLLHHNIATIPVPSHKFNEEELKSYEVTFMFKINEVYRMIKGLDKATFAKMVGVFPFKIDAAPEPEQFGELAE